MTKRYKDSVYFKEGKYDTKSPVPVDESGREKRVRQKAEQRLELLVGIYHYLKQDPAYLIIDGEFLIFTDKMFIEIDKMQDEWERYTKMICDYKCRRNPDAQAFKDVVNNDINISKLCHWITVFDNEMQKMELEIKGSYTEKYNIKRKVEDVIYEIIIEEAPLRYFSIWRPIIDYPYLVYVKQCLKVLFFRLRYFC